MDVVVSISFAPSQVLPFLNLNCVDFEVRWFFVLAFDHSYAVDLMKLFSLIVFFLVDLTPTEHHCYCDCTNAFAAPFSPNINLIKNSVPPPTGHFIEFRLQYLRVLTIWGIRAEICTSFEDLSLTRIYLHNTCE